MSSAIDTSKLTLENIPLISADSHVNEPDMLWVENLPEKFKDQAPVRIDPMRDKPITWKEIKDSGETLDPAAGGGVAHADIPKRLEDLKRDGITGEVIFPSSALFALQLEPELATACCKVYNDWLVSNFRGVEGEERFSLPGLIPLFDRDEGLDEIRRVHAMGMDAAMLPVIPEPFYNDPHWEPLWQLLTELKMPATTHLSVGQTMFHYRGKGSPIMNYVTTQTFAARTAGMLAASGVLERFPDVHFTFVETNASWLGYLMFALDDLYVTHESYRKPVLKELPSFYVKRQIHATFMDEPYAVLGRSITGSQAALWGSDYPHAEGTYPHSREAVVRQFQDVPIEEVMDMTGRTTARIFGLEKAYEDALAAVTA